MADHSFFVCELSYESASISSTDGRKSFKASGNSAPSPSLPRTFVAFVKRKVSQRNYTIVGSGDSALPAEKEKEKKQRYEEPLKRTATFARSSVVSFRNTVRFLFSSIVPPRYPRISSFTEPNARVPSKRARIRSGRPHRDTQVNAIHRHHLSLEKLIYTHTHLRYLSLVRIAKFDFSVVIMIQYHRQF